MRIRVFLMGLPAAALLFAGPARACDDRFPATCAPVPAVAEPENKPDAAQAATKRKKRSETTSLRKRAASRTAAHKANARASLADRSRRATRKTSARAAVPLPPEAPMLFDNMDRPPVTRGVRATPMAALNAADDVDASAGATQVTKGDMPSGPASANAPIEAGPSERSAEPIVIVSQTERNEIDVAALAAPKPVDQNWLVRLLAALGGAFAAASVLRFLAA